MAMITEDYVSFETAKLLKEKGFDDILVYTYYLSYGGVYLAPMAVTNKDLCAHGHVAAPTLQMAMKWLLEAHKLFVKVCPSVEGYYWAEKWHSYVDNLEKRYPFGKFIGTFNTHEQACEAAIKYCLENLI